MSFFLLFLRKREFQVVVNVWALPRLSAGYSTASCFLYRRRYSVSDLSVFFVYFEAEL